MRNRLEAILTLLVIVWLAWQGFGFGGGDWLRGENDRYLKDRDLEVTLPPEVQHSRLLKNFCKNFVEWLPARDEAVCHKYRHTGFGALFFSPQNNKAAGGLPPDAALGGRVKAALPALAEVHEALLNALTRPLAAARQERQAWEQHAAEGFQDQAQNGDFHSAEDLSRAFRDAYQLEIRNGRAYPKPLECAWNYLVSRIEATGQGADTGAVEALAALAAMLEGQGANLPSTSFWATAAYSDREVKKGCQGLPVDAARQGADLVRQVRSSEANAAKAGALMDVLPGAFWQLALWAVTAWLLLALGRRGGRLNRLLFVALISWALVAFMTHPHMEWLDGNPVHWLTARWVLPLALIVLATTILYLPVRHTVLPSEPASSFGYPGFVLFLGLGWWLLLDLSSFGHFENRFQGLYQEGNLFVAFMVVSLVTPLRNLIARIVLECLSYWPLAAAGDDRRSLLYWGLGIAVTGVMLVLFWLFFQAHRQFTSELFRTVLLLGLSWMLLARAEILASPWLQPLPTEGARFDVRAFLAALPRRLKLAAPLAPLLMLVLGGLLLTDDMGPLLVVLYFAAIFIGVAVVIGLSSWFSLPLAIAAGMATLALYEWGLSCLLLWLGNGLEGRIGERVQSAEQPFLASNDQMAHVLWFQDAAREAGGFSFGAVPWCGEIAGTCRGVPPQIQSDYMFTALLGVLGPWAWFMLGLFILWLWRVAHAHPAATTGRVDASDLRQGWLSWLALCWAGLSLTQMAVTVAGNLCWLPLTGITFPFLSYGAWSLLANSLMLGLVLDINRKAP